MNSKIKGNIAMAVSKFFSGLNQNALKYLVPDWMSPYSGVVMRCGFGALAYWTMGCFKKASVKPTSSQCLKLFLLGFVLMFGYMCTLLLGLQYTTPVTSSIFISLQPAIVFIIMAIWFREKVTSMKIIGIVLGISGAVICVLTLKASGTAKDPALGALFCALSLLTYSAYLVISGRFVKKLDNITVSKWTFLGGAVSSVIAILFIGWHAPVLHQGIFTPAMLTLLFVLIFPTTVSYLLLDIGLRCLNTTIVALYGNLILIVSTVTSYILKQDVFSWWQMLAIAMMIASVYFVEVAESKSAKAPKPANQ